MTIQELVDILNKRYENTCSYISSIVEDIDDYIMEGEISSNLDIIVVTGEYQEIDTNYHEFVSVDAIDARDWAKNPNERSGAILGVEWNKDENCLDIWFIPNVSYEQYYGVDD